MYIPQLCRSVLPLPKAVKPTSLCHQMRVGLDCFAVLRLTKASAQVMYAGLWGLSCVFKDGARAHSDTALEEMALCV